MQWHAQIHARRWISKRKRQAPTHTHKRMHTHTQRLTNMRTQARTRIHIPAHKKNTHKDQHTHKQAHTHTSNHTYKQAHTHISRVWISPVPYLNTGREESSRHRWTLEWLISKWYSSECTWRPHEGRCPQQEQSGRNQQWRMSTRSAAKDRSTTDSTISWHLPLCLRYQSCYINSRIQAHY